MKTFNLLRDYAKVIHGWLIFSFNFLIDVLKRAKSSHFYFASQFEIFIYVSGRESDVFKRTEQ